MKILLISYYYKHKNAMASVRAVKLAKYFSQQGHDVTVLTSNQIDTWTKSYVEPQADEKIAEYYAPQVKRWTLIQKYLAKRKKKGVARAKTLATVEAPSQTRKSFKARLKSFLSWFFYFNVAKQEDICMFRGLKKEYKKNIKEKFDVAIATYPTYGAFLTGIWLKKRGYCQQLVADFRDPLYNPGFRDRKTEANFDKKCLKNIIRYADKVVCVSEGIADGIKEQHPNLQKAMRIITNGFDRDDVQDSNVPVEFDASKINFVYAGALYHGKRCVDMLASILRELIDSEQIKQDSFAFHYAGSDYEELVSQLQMYGLEDTAVDHGFVSRAEAISMQKKASALLLLTWNEASYQGVIPGKLFEYMAVNVPIIALITGDVANSEVAKMIRASNAGCAAEEAAEGDYEALKEYVSLLFNRQISMNGEVDIYCYQNIAKEYNEFIKEN